MVKPWLCFSNLLVGDSCFFEQGRIGVMSPSFILRLFFENPKLVYEKIPNDEFMFCVAKREMGLLRSLLTNEEFALGFNQNDDLKKRISILKDKFGKDNCSKPNLSVVLLACLYDLPVFVKNFK